ncbi:neuronal acetylcholine receptor subunit alpha-10-like [Parasteatoda tepidariorum]|uniref:neuronal acetylcholine receptor subunit alpha-10-like n=1 Tax=Parasteatoda tepidariorum TaxID=114398 RepID=UPI00077FB5EB|nr:neuronal acetylcholine receptor subunit alpha-10-like [Parasteatoda tepidariorum]
MATSSWIHLVIGLLLIVCMGEVSCDDQEFRLVRYLMSNYDSAVRPSLSVAQPVAVAFRMSLLALLTLDERQGVLSSSCRIIQKWNDVHLRWNSSDFGGVTTVRIPASQIWRPDIILRNNADPSTPWNLERDHAVLRSSGDISWTTQILLKSTCALDLRFFPFDFHLCHLNFTSWSYDTQQVTLTAEPTDLSNYHPNPEFYLEDVLVSPGSGKALAFSLVLRRRPGPHLLRQVLPCFLITGLAALTFLVPASSAERVTLAMGCFLSLLLISVATGGGPKAPAPQLPLLGVYQICSLCLVSSIAFLSAMTLGLHSKGSDGIPPSPWLRKCVLGCLAPMLLVHPCPTRKDSLNFQEADEEDRKKGKKRPVSGSGGSSGPPIERYSSSPQLLRRRSAAGSGGGGGGGGERSSEEFERRFLRVLDRVHETLERNEARDMENENKEAAKDEWRRVAQVTDRLLLVLFLTGAMLAAALLFAFAPL